MRAGYLPASFGHAAQMPQLYRQLGFPNAAVWRGVPLTIDRVAFIWEAPDDSQILTAYMGNSYSHGVDLPTEADGLATRIAAALRAIEPFHPGSDILLMNGNDHVLPQRALSAAVRGASGRLNGTRIRLARLDDYLATLPPQEWPLWRGELRSSARANVLMGTLSVRLGEKQLYAKATRMLERIAEPIASLTRIDAAGELQRAWTLLLQNAAHDTACGSGIDAVAEESGQRSVDALTLTSSVRNFASTIAESGPLRGSLETRFDYVVPSGLSKDRRRRADVETVLPVRLAISLEAETPRLDIELDVINRATDHRLRVHFPLPFSATATAADTPFHVTRRPVVAAHRDPRSAELELPTYPMWSFVDASDGRVGLALIADGLHEYEVLPGARQELALPLLRGVGWLARDHLATRTGHAGPALETPGAQVLGEHRFRYSLFFHAGDWEGAAVWRAAEAALVPMLPGRGPAVTTPVSAIELEPDCIQMTACIPRPTGFDLRLLNASDQPRVAIVRCALHLAGVAWITLGGDLREDVRLNDGVMQFSLRPWEMATLRITR